MVNTKKGVETQELIIRTAKKLFYVKGLMNTSVKEICKEANIHLGTFTYYFSKRKDLVNFIYNECWENSSKYVNAMTDEQVDALHKHLYTAIVFYYGIYSDANICVFQKDLMEQTSMNNVFYDMASRYVPFIEYGTVLKDESSLLITSDNAVRRELSENFINENVHDFDSIIAFYRNVYHITARLFGIERSLIDSCIDDAVKFLMNHLDNGISVLK